MKGFILGAALMLLTYQIVGRAQISGPRAKGTSTVTNTGSALTTPLNVNCFQGCEGPTEFRELRPQVTTKGALVVRMYCIMSVTRDEWEPCKDIKDGEHFLGRLSSGNSLLLVADSVATIPSVKDKPVLSYTGGAILPDHFYIDRSCWTDQRGNVK